MLSVEQLASLLEKAIREFPREFYGSFKYTKTGRNLTHPITLGLLSKILWQDTSIVQIGIDFRLNLNGTKFQPDVVVLDYRDSTFEPSLFIDYESPNSSDARIKKKDVDAYIEWIKHKKSDTPYFIITTLPNRANNEWELRYTSPGGCNQEFGGHLKSECLSILHKNPFRFWYSYYSRDLKDTNLPDIHFVNIDYKSVRVVNLPISSSIDLPCEST